MIRIRGAGPKDLSQLEKLSRHLSSYNFPSGKSGLRKLIRLSCGSFSGSVRDPLSRLYLFVAEDTKSGVLTGSSLIIARHGSPRLPHLSFRVERVSKKSSSLRKSVQHTTLTLSVNHTGFTEIGGLVVLPAWRRRPEDVARQLSYARFAYIARHPSLFRPRVLVEYLPRLDPRKGNALWDALGARFTGLGYAEADALSARTKEFILSLFPKEKLYADLLPFEARETLGEPGDGARASLRLLEKIGFRYLNQVDPFDGGPHYGAELKKISLIRGTRLERTEAARRVDGEAKLLMREEHGRVFACVSRVKRAGGRVRIEAAAARAIGLKNGETVSVTPFAP